MNSESSTDKEEQLARDEADKVSREVNRARIAAERLVTDQKVEERRLKISGRWHQKEEA